MSKTYRQKLIAAVDATPVAALSPTESRIVEIMSRLGVTSYLGTAFVERGQAFQMGAAVERKDIERSVDLLMVAAGRLEAKLQDFRQDLETESSKRNLANGGSDHVPH